MATHPEEEPVVGWAVQVSPDQIRRSQERAAMIKNWLTLRHILLVVLGIWNATFLSAFIYANLNHDPSRNVVLAVIFWLWILGDIAILLCALSARLIQRARRIET
jgi:hypothetical protein